MGTLIEQTRILLKLINGKIKCRQKESTLEHIMQKSVHADMKLTKNGHIPTENSKINPFVVKSFLMSNCKRFLKSAIRENFNLKPETEMK